MSGLLSVIIGAVIGAGIGSIVGVLIFKPKTEVLENRADGVKFIDKVPEMKDKRLTDILDASLETYTDTLVKSKKKKPSVIIRLDDKNAKDILESLPVKYVYVTGTIKETDDRSEIYGTPSIFAKLQKASNWIAAHSEKGFTGEKVSVAFLLVMLNNFHNQIQGTAEAYCVSNPKFKLEVVE